jgi:membrane dipeptidase
MILDDFSDHRANPAAWAAELGISREAVDLYLGSEVIDLHIDSFIWHRIFRYDLCKRHGHGAAGARFYSQVDFPRVLEAAIGGATWIITTNPARSAAARRRAFNANIRELQRIFARVPEQFELVRNVAEYQRARAAGKHAAFIGIQGGNALDDGPDALDDIPDDLVLRITLVHLSSSSLGVTSAPLKMGQDTGLTDAGRAYVERLNDKKIFVDLAHISRKGFFDAIEVHDKSQPLLVTHTGIAGVFEHWRNVDDEQLRAVADLGGTVGVMYQSSFLGDPYLGGSAARIVDHLEHIVNTVGDDHAALGSDWDGAIVTPRDMPSCLELPILVQLMLERGWSDERIRKILGQNFLRVVADLRG